MMIWKHCLACRKDVWHNAMGTKGEYRCTYCAHPVTTGPKRESNMTVHQQQLAKVRT